MIRQMALAFALLFATGLLANPAWAIGGDDFRQMRYGMRWFDKHKDNIQAQYRKADAIEKAFAAQGRTDGVKKMRDIKRRLLQIKRQMPERRGLFKTLQETATYKEQTLRIHARKLRQLAADLKAQEQRVAADLGGTSAGPPTTSGEPEPGTGSRAWDTTGVEIYIAGLSGNVEFSINGREAEQVGDTLPMTDKIRLVARVMGEQRKRVLNFRGTGSVVSYQGGASYLNYKAKLPDGSIGETTWEVVDEGYKWSVEPSRTGGRWTVTNSGLNRVTKDMLVLEAPRPMKFMIRVEGHAKWKTTYKTHGAPIERLDRESGTIIIAVAPK